MVGEIDDKRFADNIKKMKLKAAPSPESVRREDEHGEERGEERRGGSC